MFGRVFPTSRCSRRLARNMPVNTDHLDPVTISVPTALKLSGLGRTKLYELITSKQIRSVRVGARRLIDFASLKAFLTSQEA
jgi:excisionase family DNA binding protein